MPSPRCAKAAASHVHGRAPGWIMRAVPHVGFCRKRRRCAGTLLSGLNENEMRPAFDASAELCVPHLLYLLDAVTNQARRTYLIETHRAKYGALLHELEEFCRQHNYRHSKEGFGKEGDSWIRPVKMIVEHMSVRT